MGVVFCGAGGTAPDRKWAHFLHPKSSTRTGIGVEGDSSPLAKMGRDLRCSLKHWVSEGWELSRSRAASGSLGQGYEAQSATSAADVQDVP